MITVTFTECSSQRTSWEARVRTNDPDTALSRAVQKIWGRTAWFWLDRGLSAGGTRRYGQIAKPLPRRVGGGNTTLTGRIMVDFEVPAP